VQGRSGGTGTVPFFKAFVLFILYYDNWNSTEPYNLQVISIRRLVIPCVAAGDMESHPAGPPQRGRNRCLEGRVHRIVLPSRTFSHESPLLFPFRSPDMLEHLPEVFEFLADMYFSFFRGTIQFGFS
jgi:hypothetical protein